MVTSYYNFLKSIGEENLPLFNEEENKFIDSIEEMLPIVRVDEYLIINQIINDGELSIEKIIGYNSRVNKESIENALKYLESKGILVNNFFPIDNISNIRDYLEDLIQYGLNRYEIEFGDFVGEYKLYANYSKEQTMISVNKSYDMNVRLKGTFYETDSGNTYVYVGLNKDAQKEERWRFKDKFISPSIFQWESENYTTRDNGIGQKIINTKKVYLFVRKMKEEDNVLLPFTYFGTGTFENMRESFTEENGNRFNTLLMDIRLDNIVPEEYWTDFNIPRE